MKITVLGTGHMGAAIATALTRTPHNILLRGSTDGSRSCMALCERLGLNEANKEDIINSDIVFFVMPSDFIQSAAELVKGFNGIIVSVVGFDNYLLNENQSPKSASETIADLIPTARIVHGFTWMAAEVVEHPDITGKTSVVHCSDDSRALNVVCTLTQEMGMSPVRAGKLINARYAESAGFLWGAIAFEGGYGVRTFFEVHPEK
ncbi:NADPH-dependent F420 reductase [Providencia sp. PROV134]|uniref:NADPH-dependent F420 reductase n=1 Tax=Providencia sp. PROV134 TaxID=2949844 RepID=UPI00234A8A2D|nr:NAD(P)-binding domain-containing protein [Providencia sp. PROV134]